MRTPITLKIKFKSSNLDQFIERYSVDVSRGGIFIRTKEPLPVGTQLRFEFQLQDASSLIAGDGTVVWIREHDPARQGVAPGMGVRFDKLATDSQKVLDRILSEKQKRGDAQLESRFDAGVRASASASGTLSSSARVAGHNDFSGGESRSQTPLPGAIPGLAGPEDEFGNESTRVMQNELVQSLADKTRGQEDAKAAANAFSEPEPTRKASVEELKLAVQGSAVEKSGEVETKKPEPKVEIAASVPVAVVELKKEEVKPAPVVELKKEEAKPAPVVEAKKEEPKPEAKKDEPKAINAKHKKNKQDEQRAETKNGEVKKTDDKPVKPAEKKEEQPATAAPFPKTGEPARKRSPMPLYAAVALVATVGGYTYFRNKGGDEEQKPAAQQQPAAQPEQPKVAQNDTPKPTETPAAAEAKGDKPEAVPTPAETPNPAKPDKEPTAVTAEKPAGLAVAVASDPAGATVTLDGKPVDGATPTTLSGLDAKKVYDLKVSMKGFHDWKVKLKPKAGDKIDAALVPNEKVVEVASTPPGADVMLDGKRVGKTPFTIHKLDLTKAHALEVKRAGFVPQSRSISATDTFESKGDKDVLALAMTLEAQPKVVAEKTTPAVAKPAAKPVARKPPAVKKPAEEKPAEAATTEKPAAEKPAVAEKPAAEKPAEAATEKPAAEKPAAEKPAGDKPAAGIKVPSWMKQKPAEGGDKASAPPASDAPAP
jgi:uncharacterized protein (TIGR02266 family)